MDTLTKELALFWRKFGRLLDSGVPVLSALDVIKEETGNPDLQEAICRLHKSIKESSTLVEGLAKSPGLFPLSVRTIVKAAEAAGRVDKACFVIADGIADGSLLAEPGTPLPTAPTAGPKPDKRVDVSGGTEGDGGADAPIIKLATNIIVDAWKARASDIHLESTTGDLRVRFRVDGALRDMQAVPAQLSGAVINRFKFMAGLNVAEKRVPQDGRMQLTVEGQKLDLRVSAIPSLDGEDVVARVLAETTRIVTLEDQGFTAPSLTLLRSWMATPYGLILVTGPTGSGKTTTLYSMVQELNRPERKIVMAEDPVELRIPGVRQMQIRPALGLTFAAALRAILRQAPNIIVTTDIRDRESVLLMIEAALTGHLVMSTLHTDDTAEALQRLIDIGVEPFLVDSALIGVMSQRLVRVVCPRCKEEYRPEPWVTESVTLPAGARFFRGKGCEHCFQTGYRGRIAIHELLAMDDSLRKAVKEEAGTTRFKELAVKAGMVPLRGDGIAKALQGITTLEEVLQVCGR